MKKVGIVVEYNPLQWASVIDRKNAGDIRWGYFCCGGDERELCPAGREFAFG